MRTPDPWLNTDVPPVSLSRQVRPMIDDVPVTVDIRLAGRTRDWTDAAMSLHPWRAEFVAVGAGAKLNQCVGTAEGALAPWLDFRL
jgi:hypothetical protein